MEIIRSKQYRNNYDALLKVRLEVGQDRNIQINGSPTTWMHQIQNSKLAKRIFK